MKDNNYNFLMKNLSANNEEEKLKIVDDRISEIISKSSNPQRTLEALICMFEGKSNVAISYAVMAIAYSVLTSAVTLIPMNNMDKDFCVVVLFIIALLLAGIAMLILKRDAKRAFILSALRFRYEREQVDNKTLGTEVNSNIKEYIVKVKENI